MADPKEKRSLLCRFIRISDVPCGDRRLACRFELGFCFVLFHKILFRNDYWIFDPACDPVITILPDAYFLHAAALILLCVLAASLFSLLLFRLLRRKISNSAK